MKCSSRVIRCGIVLYSVVTHERWLISRFSRVTSLSHHSTKQQSLNRLFVTSDAKESTHKLILYTQQVKRALDVAYLKRTSISRVIRYALYCVMRFTLFVVSYFYKQSLGLESRACGFRYQGVYAQTHTVHEANQQTNGSGPCET